MNTFQQRVDPWMQECFGRHISADAVERNYRFLEESLELVQALGLTRNEAHELVNYVFNRPIGEPSQEVGGTMVTLGALCNANDLDMAASAETELARITHPDIIAKIRAKQASKPRFSPLPEHVRTVPDVKSMVNRFLCWKLPESFCPDGGISFNKEYAAKWGVIGTNLFTAVEAKAMFEYCLTSDQT